MNLFSILNPNLLYEDDVWKEKQNRIGNPPLSVLFSKFSFLFLSSQSAPQGPEQEKVSGPT